MKFKEYKILIIKTLQTTFFKLCVKKIMVNFSPLCSHVFAIWKLNKVICRLKEKNFNYSKEKKFFHLIAKVKETGLIK